MTADDSFLKGLRILHEPRGQARRVVDALCRERDQSVAADPDWNPNLPTDKEIARELGLKESTVAKLIELVARDIVADSFEMAMIPRRGRIFLWYRHRLWLQRRASRQSPPAA